MKRRILSLALLACSLSLSPVIAKPADSAKGKHMERMFADLNLTADQKAKLKALHQENKESHKRLFDQMKELREKTKAELQKPQPSQQVLDGYATQIGDLHKQLAQKMVAHLLQVKAILTPKQFSTMLSREPRCQGLGGENGKCSRGEKHECEGHGPGEAQGEM